MASGLSLESLEKADIDYGLVVGEWELCSSTASESCAQPVNSFFSFSIGCGLVPNRLDWSDEPNAVRPAQRGMSGGETHIVRVVTVSHVLASA